VIQIVRLGVFFALMAVSACSQASLLKTGIGDDAYTPVSTEKRIKSAHDYFDLMCQRIRRASCQNDSWSDIIMSSLNDIDERCSAYLGSLDNARRNKSGWNSALTDIGGSATSVLALTSPLSIKAIAIVEAAFDYGKTTTGEYYSAVILAEDPNVVQHIVRKLQTQYRTILSDKFDTIRSVKKKLNDRYADQRMDRGTAHYVVRGYLRLCLPVTIEAELKSIKTNVNYASDTTRTSIDRKTPVLQVLDTLPQLIGDPQ
jgi:hypothetical protein